MTDPTRIIDTERAGGTGNAAPKRIFGAEPMSVADAEEHVERVLGWRTVLGTADQAALALLREVRAQRLANETLQAVHRIEAAETRRMIAECERLRGELDRFRDALLAVIGCIDGKPADCDRPAMNRLICCVTRERMIVAGLLPQPERHDEKVET
jgi:hypothetical protein